MSAREASLPLVLLPGTLCDARVFAPLLARLRGVASLVPAMRGTRSAPGLAQRLLGLLPARFALLGFSLGGIVALEIMAQAPARVARLALLDTTARPEREATRTARRDAVAEARAMSIERYVAETMAGVMLVGEETAHRTLLVAMAGTLGIDAFDEQSEIATARVDSRARLAAIAVPTLVACGAHDRQCPPDIHAEMAEAIPGATFACIPDAGHFALIEQPTAIADAVRAWLARPALETA